jgi:primosomal protein N' (replication factor Y)
VLVQTHNPDTPVIAALVAGDRDGFLAVEAESRRLGGWPPYGRLAAVVVSAGDAAAADALADTLARRVPAHPDVEVLGPAPAPYALLRGRHRRRLLVKSRRRAGLQPFLKAWLADVPTPGSTRIAVDVDPYSFL